MKKMFRKCKICKKHLKGIGSYSFTYLDETVYLCGHHANQIMQMIFLWNEEKNTTDSKEEEERMKTLNETGERLLEIKSGNWYMRLPQDIEAIEEVKFMLEAIEQMLIRNGYEKKKNE